MRDHAQRAVPVLVDGMKGSGAVSSVMSWSLATPCRRRRAAPRTFIRRSASPRGGSSAVKQSLTTPVSDLPSDRAAAGGDAVPDQSLERGDVREATVARTVPEQLVVDLHPEHTAGARPVPAISPRSVVNVVSSSEASQLARSSHRHWVQ